MKFGLFFTGIARVVLPPPGFDKEAVSRGLEKMGKFQQRYADSHRNFNHSMFSKV